MKAKLDICERCDGDGYIYQAGKSNNGFVCPSCNGTGRIVQNQERTNNPLGRPK